MSSMLSDYSLAALQEKSLRDDDGDFEIVDYNRKDYVHGYTIISYHEYMRGMTHLNYLVKSGGLLLPTTLFMDGMIRVLQEKRIRYFHTEDGVLLGRSESEAIERANEIGEHKMRMMEWKKASSYFNIADYLCNDTRNLNFRTKKENAANKAREMEERKEREASNFFEQALHIWNDAWSRESSGETTEAETKFHTCKNLFSEAAMLMPNNVLYNSWLQALNLKLEGDTSFNDGVTLQEGGSQLCKMHNYEEALTKYKEALQKYSEGLDRSKDSRFRDCMGIVNDCISELEKVIREGDMLTDLERMRVSSSTCDRSCNSQQLCQNSTVFKVIDS